MSIAFGSRVVAEPAKALSYSWEVSGRPVLFTVIKSVGKGESPEVKLACDAEGWRYDLSGDDLVDMLFDFLNAPALQAENPKQVLVGVRLRWQDLTAMARRVVLNNLFLGQTSKARRLVAVTYLLTVYSLQSYALYRAEPFHLPDAGGWTRTLLQMHKATSNHNTSDSLKLFNTLNPLDPAWENTSFANDWAVNTEPQGNSPLVVHQQEPARQSAVNAVNVRVRAAQKSSRDMPYPVQWAMHAETPAALVLKIASSVNTIVTTNTKVDKVKSIISLVFDLHKIQSGRPRTTLANMLLRAPTAALKFLEDEKRTIVQSCTQEIFHLFQSYGYLLVLDLTIASLLELYALAMLTDDIFTVQIIDYVPSDANNRVIENADDEEANETDREDPLTLERLCKGKVLLQAKDKYVFDAENLLAFFAQLKKRRPFVPTSNEKIEPAIVKVIRQAKSKYEFKQGKHQKYDASKRSWRTVEELPNQQLSVS